MYEWNPGILQLPNVTGIQEKYVHLDAVSEQGYSYSFNAYYISDWLILPSAGMFLVTAVCK